MIGDAAVERLSVLVEASSRGQTQKVQRPSEVQVRKDLEGGKGSIAHDFVPGSVESVSLKILGEAVVLLGGWDMRLTVGEMVGSSVMLGVGVLPGKVRDQQGLVEDETNNIIEGLRIRECSVSALVCQHPRSGHDGSHPEGIESPSQRPSQEGCGLSGHVGGEHL